MGPESKCPTCERTLGEHHRLLLSKLVSSIEEHIKSRASSIADREKLMADLGTNQRRKKVLIERKEKLQNDWKIEQRLKSTIDGLEERKEQLTNESKILKDRADALSSIDFSEKEYADLRLRISALKPVAERSRALRSESGRSP